MAEPNGDVYVTASMKLCAEKARYLSSLFDKINLVDFVCSKGDRRYYVQSACAIPDREKLEQEQASLTRIGDSFRKVIVVRDPIIPPTSTSKTST